MEREGRGGRGERENKRKGERETGRGEEGRERENSNSQGCKLSLFTSEDLSDIRTAPGEQRQAFGTSK